MKTIDQIERIQVNLLKLKPIKMQKAVYDSYNIYLKQFFDNGVPINKYFEDIDCPLCSFDAKQTLMDIDFFSYTKCNNCDTIYNNPRLKVKYLEEMYAAGEYQNYVKKLTIPGDKIRENVTEIRKFNQIQSLFNKNGTILDVGCGAGVFLSIALKNGWDCTGIELSKAGASAAKDKGINIIEKPFDEFISNRNYNCISFWGVLEHVINPLGMIKKAAYLLEKDGIIVFEVPSADSLLMNYIIKNKLNPYRFIESARHLTFFSINAIKSFCRTSKLELEYVESNGLDLQTILLYDLESEIVNKLKNIQQLIDESMLGDHYRVFLRKL